jgi:hypothetical protein
VKPAPHILSRFEIETRDRPYFQADPLRPTLQCGNMCTAFAFTFRRLLEMRASG